MAICYSELVIFRTLILFFFPNIILISSAYNCKLSSPFSIVHKYYQPGDLIIAAIIYQVFFLSNEITFQSFPSHEVLDQYL